MNLQGEYSQPFLKPPHLEQPLSTLLLSDSTMAFGRMLVSDGEGNYRGPLMLPLKEGYVYIIGRHFKHASSKISSILIHKTLSGLF